MATRFYINSPLALGPVQLAGPEAHHLASVCRLRPGDAVRLFNGDGQEYHGRITAVGRRAVEVDVLEVRRPERELPFILEVAAPVPKGDRAQFLIEKLTELGVSAFVPLETERSVVAPGQAKLEKLERYVIEASKQCGRNTLMRIERLSPWPTHCSQVRENEVRWLAHPGGAGVATLAPRPAIANVRIAIGPEGGFTEDEIASGRAFGWRIVDLGPRILRVETAAILLACLAAMFSPREP